MEENINTDHARIKALEKEIQECRFIKNSLLDQLKFEKVLAEISFLFTNMPASKFDEFLKKGLRRIGDFLKVPLCSLSLLSEDKQSTYSYHSWASKDLEKLGEFIQNPSMLWPWSTNKFLNGESYQIRSPADLPPEASVDRANLERLNVNSVAAVPLSVGKSVIGCFSIGTLNSCRTWSEDEMKRIQILGEVVANAAVRKEKEVKIQEAFEEIQKLKDQLKADYIYLREEIDFESGFHQMIGQSPAIKEVFSNISQIAPLDTTVMILGESGTGKELVARAIHAAGPRKNRPMVKVNCAALPANLIESELFGHEKGAFTSAEDRQVGRFEVAHGSTLFLDEIGELPLESQSKLLRVLQEGEFERLGSSKTIKVDVRVIAATNRNLEEEIKNGHFRRDLWYRLNIYPIMVPPLRERTEDIVLLVDEFVKRYTRKMGNTVKRIPCGVMSVLQNYQWPGNIRELENVIERAVINTKGTSLQLLDNLSPKKVPDEGKMADLTLEEVERNHILSILTRTNWRVSGSKGAALILGVNPSTLCYRIKKLGIKRSSKHEPQP